MLLCRSSLPVPCQSGNTKMMMVANSFKGTAFFWESPFIDSLPCSTDIWIYIYIYLIFFSRIFLKVGRFSFIASQILFFCSLWQKNASYDKKVDFHIILTSLSFYSWLNLDVKSSGYFFIEMSKKEKIVILSSSCCVMMSYCNFFELLNQRQKKSGVRCRREHLQC